MRWRYSTWRRVCVEVVEHRVERVAELGHLVACRGSSTRASSWPSETRRAVVTSASMRRVTSVDATHAERDRGEPRERHHRRRTRCDSRSGSAVRICVTTWRAASTSRLELAVARPAASPSTANVRRSVAPSCRAAGRRTLSRHCRAGRRARSPRRPRVPSGRSTAIARSVASVDGSSSRIAVRLSRRRARATGGVREPLGDLGVQPLRRRRTRSR